LARVARCGDWWVGGLVGLVGAQKEPSTCLCPAQRRRPAVKGPPGLWVVGGGVGGSIQGAQHLLVCKSAEVRWLPAVGGGFGVEQESKTKMGPRHTILLLAKEDSTWWPRLLKAAGRAPPLRESGLGQVGGRGRGGRGRT